MKRFVIRWVCALLLGFGIALPKVATAQAPAGPSLYYVFVRASRVALLPFVNWAEGPQITAEIMSRVRAELTARNVELADSAQVAAVLRKYRIRNTAELTVAQIQKLSSELEVSYLLVGTVDYVERGETSFEVALSARLLYLPTIQIVWSANASAHSDDRHWPLAIGRTHDTPTLVHRAASRLFRTFQYATPAPAPRVTALRLKERDIPALLPCRTILVLPFANESATKAAGFMVTNLFVSELLHDGYNVVEPGRVKDVLLSAGSLSNGEISLDLLAKCREDLAADFVITGAVYHCGTAPLPDSGEDPSLTLDVRIIDTRDGAIRWARSRDRAGRDALALFGFGGTSSMGSLSRSMVHRLVRAIPHLSQQITPLTMENATDVH